MNKTATRIGPLTVFVAPLLGLVFLMLAGVVSVGAGNPLTGIGVALVAVWPVAVFTGAYTVVRGRPGWALLRSRRSGAAVIGGSFAFVVAGGVLCVAGALL